MGGVLISDRRGSGCTCGLYPWCSSGKVGNYAKTTNRALLTATPSNTIIAQTGIPVRSSSRRVNISYIGSRVD